MPVGSRPLGGAFGARAPGLGLALGLEVECDCCADQVLQCRLIDLLAFADVDGAPDVSFEAGVEETCRVVQGCSLGKCQLDDALVRLSGADDTAVGEDG